jgi:CAAX prenyl protease-like protein
VAAPPAPPARAYIAPFAALIALVAVGPYLPAAWSYTARTAAVLVALAVFSRAVVRLRPERTLASIGIGVLAFAVWIGPDLLFPGYRHSWLFQNFLTGAGGSGVAPDQRTDLLVIVSRIAGSVVAVPIAEELFWRGWLMRWLISPRVETVRMGAWSAQAFWIVALLFASEHGPYWDVGLVVGVLFNAWMVRTRSLADCILAHAVTNGCLAAWVVAAGQWQYWL